MHIPKHVAFIMDGNRRWAREHAFDLLKGHESGVHSLEPLLSYAVQKKINYLTFWAFSSENWNRGKTEVELLMQVFRHFLTSPIVARAMKNGIQFRIIGDYHAFPKDIVEGIERIIEASKQNTTVIATFALNYGGRAEILDAIKTLISEGKKDINEQTFSSLLDTSGLPDPDLIIRTGGEQRLSGFLPWQSVYSELYFTNTYWPDFDEEEFDKALAEYASRERRFGK
jgi:undecaprenyl diphosphate synthase